MALEQLATRHKNASEALAPAGVKSQRNAKSTEERRLKPQPEPAEPEPEPQPEPQPQPEREP